MPSDLSNLRNRPLLAMAMQPVYTSVAMVKDGARVLAAAALLVVLPWIAVSPGIALSPTQRRFEFTEAHMGTSFRLVFYASDSDLAARLARAAFARIAQLDATMSDYRQTSELMLLCRAAGGPAQRISSDLFRILQQAQSFAELSSGAFDATAGPLVRLWRRARRTGELPDSEQLKRAIQLTGYRKLHLHKQSCSARLEEPGMLLDLGGIAKGYAADEAIALLGRNGVRSALVAAGGDVAVSNAPPHKEGWVVAIASPGRPGNRRQRSIVLRNGGVSTSGDTEQYVEIAGVRYSHIVDPRTGLALVGRNSVTVVAPNATTSDALATAASVLGPEQGLALVDSVSGCAALFVHAGEAQLSTYESKRWKLLQVR